MENIYKVYCYTFPNGKKYIGQTKRSIKERAGANGYYYQDSPLVYNAIQKYGWDNIQKDILEDNLTLEEANNQEKYYIKLYQTTDENFGYNLTIGGDGNYKSDYDWLQQLWLQGKTVGEIENITGYSKRVVDNALNCYGINGSTRIARSAGRYLAKTIHQYDMAGKYIQTFSSMGEAERVTGTPHENIIKVLKGERKSANKFRWSEEYCENLPDYFFHSPTNKITPVAQYDLQHNLIKIYPSLSAASLAMTGSSKKGGNISNVCRQKQHTAYRYKWEFVMPEN